MRRRSGSPCATGWHTACPSRVCPTPRRKHPSASHTAQAHGLASTRVRGRVMVVITQRVTRLTHKPCHQPVCVGRVLACLAQRLTRLIPQAVSPSRVIRSDACPSFQLVLNMIQARYPTCKPRVSS